MSGNDLKTSNTATEKEMLAYCREKVGLLYQTEEYWNTEKKDLYLILIDKFELLLSEKLTYIYGFLECLQMEISKKEIKLTKIKKSFYYTKLEKWLSEKKLYKKSIAA